MNTTITDTARARAGDADVESVILEWSKNGVLAEAARNAIAEHHKMGRAVTIIENDIVYLLHPGGRKEELRRLAKRIVTKYTTGTLYL